MLLLCAHSLAWAEVQLSSRANDRGLTGEALAQGRSVVIVPNVASTEECAKLLALGMRAADDQQASVWARTTARLSEFTSNNPRSEGRVRVPIGELPPQTARLFDSLLGRVFSIVDDEMPSVAALFAHGYNIEGARAPTASSAPALDASVSLSSLHASDGLEFSSREPAINLYRSRGAEFHAHTDRQTLTVLIPLTSPDTYEGGGTGFWAPDDDEVPRYGQPTSRPAVVLRPPPGSALLYGGRVTHAGMPMETGCRVIFLASFSRRRLDLELLDTL